MNGGDGIQASLTEGSRALDFFTNRTEAVKRFCEYLHEPTPDTILFFYGNGGNGKSLLLRLLKSRCCRLFADWEYVKSRPDDLLHPEAQRVDQVPSVFLDLGSSGGRVAPAEAFPSLLTLRRGLGGKQFRFPLFEFACLWYLKLAGGLTRAQLPAFFPAEDLELLGELTDAVTFSPFGSIAAAALTYLDKHLGPQFRLRFKKRGLPEERLNTILKTTNTAELIDMLPVLFAEDLNALMGMEGSPRRVVIFLDTHDALWGQDRNLTGDLFFQRDEWIRRLVGHLHLDRGIVVVMAGRTPPAWRKAWRSPVADHRVESVAIGGLPDDCAQEYLWRIGVEDESLQDWLCERARKDGGAIHPLLLGLCADIFAAAKERGVPKTVQGMEGEFRDSREGEHLIERLLLYVDGPTRDAVRAVSAARGFDRDLFLRLAGALACEATGYTFERLTRFSFVAPVGGRSGWYRVHDLVRTLLREQRNEMLLAAHSALDKHFRGQEGPTARAEAVYHHNRQDWERGLEEWLRLVGDSIDQGDYALTRCLLAVRGDLEIRGRGSLGSVMRLEGRYYAAIARYAQGHRSNQEALRLLRVAEKESPGDQRILKEVIRLLIGIGDLAFERSHNARSAAAYQAAVATCRRAEQRTGLDAEIAQLQGLALLGAGDVEAERAHRAAAQAAYSGVLRVAERGLGLLARGLPPDPRPGLRIDLHNDRGYAFAGLADLEQKRGAHQAAREAFRKAVTAYRAALRAGPTDVAVRNNIAFNLVAAAASDHALGRHGAGITKCRKAILLYDEVLSQAPEDTIVHANRARAFIQAARSRAAVGQQQRAMGDLKAALAGCDAALDLAPSDVWASNSGGLAHLALGEVLLADAKAEKAVPSLSEAAKRFQATLGEAPDDQEATVGWAVSQLRLGDAFKARGEAGAARQKYATASARLADAVDAATEDVELRRRRAEALTKSGELEAAAGATSLGVQSLRDALAELSLVLRWVPRDVKARSLRKRAQKELAGLQRG